MSIENLSQEAELRLRISSDDPRQILKWVEDLNRKLRDAGDETETVSRLQRNLERALGKTGEAGRDAGKKVADGAREGSKAWQDLQDSLKKVNDEYRKFRQGSLTGEGGGKDVSAYSTDELKRYIAIQDAANANFISDARKRVAEEERGVQRLSDLKQRSLQAEFAAIQRNAAEQKKMIDAGLATASRGIGSAETYQRDALSSRLRSARGAMSDDWTRQYNAALDEASRKTQKFSQGDLPALRYALYDVASTATITSAAIVGIGTVATMTFAKYESAFTNVERTLEPGSIAVERLRGELVQMAREIPLAFEDIAAIATLGNQLGVPADQLREFTELVAKFSTVSGMSADASARAFGKLQNILGLETVEEMSRMASAIELVGVSSAATDEEIIALAQRLGSTATRAGFTMDQIIGLSGALGSLGVAPERAQGVFETYFDSINGALAEGGEQAQAFSVITGRSIEDLNKAVRSGDGFAVFQDFIAGLQGADTVELSTALDTLGLSGLRANEVIGRISQRMPLLQESFNIAAQGASENTELNRQYALILDDLASKWQLFVNSLAGFGAAVGGQVAPAIITLLDGATALLNTLADFANSPLGGFLVSIIAWVGGAVAAFSGLIGIMALAGASVAALSTAIAGLSTTAMGSRIIAIATSIGLIKPAADGSTRSVLSLRGALKLLGAATVVGAALQFVVEVLLDLYSAGNTAIDVLVNVAQAAIWVQQQISNAFSLIGVNLPNGLAKASKELENFRSSAKKEWKNFASDMGWLDDALESTSDSAWDAGDAFNYMGGSADGAGSDLSGLGDTLDETTVKVRTLTDYASDLSGVWKRAFDIRFSGLQGQDAITSGWQKIATGAQDARLAIDDAREAILEHQRTLASIGADRSIKEYWLSVAELYGDEKRAAVLRADLAELDAKANDERKKLTETQRKLSEAQDKASMSLSGNSASAIENRAALLSMVGSYQDYLEALAASGMSQEDLVRRSQQLKQEFINQATQAGFSRSEIDLYTVAFDDLTFALNNVPRQVDIEVNADPALAALREFEARLAESAAQSGTDYGNAFGDAMQSAFSQATDNSLTLMEAEVQRRLLSATVAINNALNSAFGWNTPPSGTYRQSTKPKLGFAGGGYTGDGAKFTPAGIVHRGEYVMPKRVVRNVGVENMAYIHKMGMRGRGYASGGGVGFTARPATTGGMANVVALDVGTMHQLARMLRVELAVDGAMFGRATSNAFSNSTALGAA
ncbi:phage tail tape measure protein [Microbacterium sp. No. 7]|uniref:phage tail tape measure protein n=1 Tax=Microbacterium sp. No. 7 TaxID=1714373 RepID=UPI0006D1B1E5|nr:phage tail tape measure protein [Microbacterium sp. No. 7]ALJ19578.1 hypothetical protein AOA12_06510 [Microbacterium sp. No. 7]